MSYYFSDHHYQKAHFLHSIASDYLDHYIPLYIFLGFQRIASMLRDIPHEQQLPTLCKILSDSLANPLLRPVRPYELSPEGDAIRCKNTALNPIQHLSNTVYPRAFIGAPEAAPPERSFVVMTYNILQQKLMRFHDYADPKITGWPYRKHLILSEIRHFRPDVLALQEVQSFPELPANTYDHAAQLSQALHSLNYETFYLTKSPPHGTTTIGCLLALRRSLFRVHHTLRVNIRRVLTHAAAIQSIPASHVEQFYGTQTALLLDVEHVPSQYRFAIAVTHLMVPVPFRMPLNQQLVALDAELAAFCKEHHLKRCVFMGDFNMIPGTGAYEMLTTGVLPATHHDHAEADEQGLLLPFPNLELHFRWESAYATVLGSEPELTNIKPDFRECLDYILINKTKTDQSLTVSRVLAIPPRAVLIEENGGIPSSKFPSDHIPIAACIIIHPENQNNYR